VAAGRLRGVVFTLLVVPGGRTGLLDEIDEDAGVGTASSEESRDDVEDGSGNDAMELSRNFDGILVCEFVEGE